MSEEVDGPIRGVVARVINANRLVINRGFDHDVSEGDTFAVLRPTSEEIVDPETGETIGEIELEKVRVKVTEVHSKMSIASPYRKVVTGGGGFDLFGPRQEVPEKIETDSKELPMVDKTVHVGDPVVQLNWE